MSDPTLTMKAGIAPYGDGSGHQMMVTIEQDSKGAEPTISFDSVFRLPASEWPAAVETINRLLSAAVPPAERGCGE